MKYQRPKYSINRCPMLITCQRKLDFGPSDQPAMDRRLSTCQFKSLANPKKRAATWVKKHPMKCLIWATRKAQEAKHRETDEEDQSGTDEERALKQSEKEALQSVSLEEIIETLSTRTGGPTTGYRKRIFASCHAQFFNI